MDIAYIEEGLFDDLSPDQEQSAAKQRRQVERRRFLKKIIAVALFIVLAMIVLTIIALQKSSQLQYQHLVRFEGYKPDENRYKMFCSGSLVSPRHVLSAAHCFEGEGRPTVANVHAVLGSDSVDPAVEVRVAVKAVNIYPDYASHGHNGHDIAIVELARPINSLKPISLAADFDRMRDGDGSAGLAALYAGWGIQRIGGENWVEATSKKSGPMELLAKTAHECGPLAEAELCSVYDGDLSNAPYPGDSGAPVMIEQAGQKLWQLAVLVRGHGLEKRDKITITAVQPHCPWLEQMTGGEVRCENMPNSK